MRTAIIVALSLLSAPALAQWGGFYDGFDRNQRGLPPQDSGSQGLSATRQGNTTYFSNGMTATRNGNTTYFSNGMSCRHYGRETYCD